MESEPFYGIEMGSRKQGEKTRTILPEEFYWFQTLQGILWNFLEAKSTAHVEKLSRNRVHVLTGFLTEDYNLGKHMARLSLKEDNDCSFYGK